MGSVPSVNASKFGILGPFHAVTHATLVFAFVCTTAVFWEFAEFISDQCFGTHGFVRRSRLFEGNATEAHTLEKMLRDLGARANALVICDAGIATADNLNWLIGNGYRYLAVSREQHRQFDATEATALESAGGETIRVHKVLSDDGQEVRLRLYCHSTGREKKEVAIVGRFVERFEQGLAKLDLGLAKPRGEKRYDKIMERIGRLKEKSHGLGISSLTYDKVCCPRKQFRMSLHFNTQPKF